ncbi:YopX family protein [Bacillus inaquosorum]|uniref:YopX family protein n=1 Tax=Bacillus inaquosorum TaxID=483913 RepID=UPI0022824F07|nr:YopX family protein [Bacillus inaquosorum]MCY7785288.1 YopX family protein [Bacillus inaquosorum]
MNTAYRVWDGEGMYYWDDEELSLEIKMDEWVLWRNDPDGCRVAIAKSFDGESVLMWGTGLKDKNEKMIYEKDIDMTDGEPMIVVYENGHYGLKFPDDHTYFDFCMNWRECEIGGDVYQNPELLEGAE